MLSTVLTWSDDVDRGVGAERQHLRRSVRLIPSSPDLAGGIYWARDRSNPTNGDYKSFITEAEYMQGSSSICLLVADRRSRGASLGPA